jgi:pSer/pThr/pTyr-binding forkhead associated (FHA) protein
MTSIESKEDKIEYYHTEDRCCFWWQITRGPHINTVYHYCVQSQGESCLLVGRQKKCWIRLKKDLEVSGKHAEFEFLADCSSFTLKDLKSTNGTRLNGLVLEPQRSYLLHPHDLILIGKTTLRFLKGQKMCVMKKDDTCSQEQRSDNINLNAPDDGPVDHFVSNKENLAIQPTRNCNGDSIEKKALSIDVAQQKTSSKSGGEQYKDFHPDEMIGKLFCPTIQKADIDCFVCHKDLSTMDILHRQMHLNACLDGVKPPFSTTTNTATTKKRNRVTDSCKNTVENEQLNLALALSKSLVEPHEQIAMEIQFVSSQMAEIDMQVMKLINQKKKCKQNIENYKRNTHV